MTLLLLVVLGGVLWLVVSAGSFSVLYLAARWPGSPPSRKPLSLSDQKLLSVDGARCVACRLCVDSCPTSTFALEASERQLLLVYRPSECVACQLCVWICPTAAISLRSDCLVVNSGPARAQVAVVAWDVPACGHRVPPAGVSANYVLEGAETACSHCSAAITARVEILEGRRVGGR